MTCYKILGYEESETSCCECCGTRCPKMRVVLQAMDGGPTLRYGRQCAALKMKTKVAIVEKRAKAALEIARKESVEAAREAAYYTNYTSRMIGK